MTLPATNSIDPRLNLREVAPALFRAMVGLDAAVGRGPVEAGLLDLVKVRASQINGCAYCIDMHTLDAMHAGETPQRLLALDAWREGPFFTSRERAALELTEAVTLIRGGPLSDAVWSAAAAEFDEEELGILLFAIATINAWNRLAIAARSPAGTYQPS